MNKNNYIILPWDSNFFGYSVARIMTASSVDLLIVLNDIKNAGVRLAYWFVDPSNKELNTLAQNNGFYLVDEKITYLKKIKGENEIERDNNIISYKNKPVTKKLIDLAIQSGGYSRFKKDPHLGKTKFEDLYEVWIRKSLNGQIADEVFVYEVNGEPMGLITLGNKEKKADIGIIAVDKVIRGKGIGTLLIQSAIQWSYKKGYKEIQVVTQKDNITACHLYEKMGFKIEGIENVYHIWFN